MQDELVDVGRRVVTAIEGLRAELAPEPVRLTPPLRKPFSGVAALALATRFCVDLDAGVSLAQRVKRVPKSHMRKDGVRCHCGELAPRTAELDPCPGDCGRWFLFDGDEAWAVRLPSEAQPS